MRARSSNHKIVTIPQKFIFHVTSSLPSPLLLLKLPIHNWKRMQQNYLKELSRELSKRLETAIAIVQTKELISSKITLLTESHMRNVHRREPRAVYISLQLLIHQKGRKRTSTCKFIHAEKPGDNFLFKCLILFKCLGKR